MAEYNKTIRSSGGDYTNYSDFITWFKSNANNAVDTTNLVVEGGYNPPDPFDFGNTSLDGIINMSTDIAESASAGMGICYDRGNASCIDEVGDGDGSLNVSGIILYTSFDVVNYSSNVHLSNCLIVLPLQSVFANCIDSSADNCVIVFNSSGDCTMAGGGGTTTIAVSNSIIVGNGSSDLTVQRLGVAGFALTLTNVYVYNYGSGDALTSGITTETNVTLDTNPDFTVDMVQSDGESLDNIISRDPILDNSSPIYPFGTYNIGVDPEYFESSGVQTPAIMWYPKPLFERRRIQRELRI